MSREHVEGVRKLHARCERGEYASTAESFDPDVVFFRIGDEFADLSGERQGLTETWAGMIGSRGEGQECGS
jgi:hypothetical protein